MEILNEVNEQDIATGYQYIVVNGEKYYFDRKLVDNYSVKDAEIDLLRAKAAQNANIELSEYSYKKINNKYQSIGIMPDGNCIVYNKSGRYGVIDANGNIVCPFIYDKIEPIMNQNDEIVHPNMYIAKRKDREIYDSKNDEYFYGGNTRTGLISSKGEVIVPFAGSEIDEILYEERKDLLHCVNRNYYKGMYAQGGYAGYENEIMIIDADKLEQQVMQQVNDNDEPKINNDETGSNNETPNTDFSTDENVKTTNNVTTSEIKSENEEINNEQVENSQISSINPNFVSLFNIFINKYTEYREAVHGTIMHVDTNIVKDLLDISDYLMRELIKMKESIDKNEFAKYGQPLMQYTNNLQNHLDCLNRASSIFTR